MVGKIGVLRCSRVWWVGSDISSMPRRNSTGVVCKFLIWGIDDVCIVLFSVEPLTVTCAGLSSSLVLIVVYLVVRDRSKQKVGNRSSDQLAGGVKQKGLIPRVGRCLICC